MNEFVLLEILAVGLTLALVFGYIATRLHLSPIVGYLLAGFFIGPHSPGFVADMHLAYELSEVGVILLMFGVGMHFDIKDLLAVKGVAIPGALIQTGAATIFGVGAGLMFGLSLPSGLILGLSLAVASTVVLMRMLEDNNSINTVHGHVAVGWLVVEDIITVLLLVLLPTLAGLSGNWLLTPESSSIIANTVHTIDVLTIPEAGGTDAAGQAANIASALGLALVRLVALWVLVLPVGGRVIPWFIAKIVKTRSNELFTVAVLVMAFAIAVGAAVFFDTSVALGAFLAGMVVGRSTSSHRAASDLLPLRDTFAVLFFLSVGMLFNPVFIIDNPGLIVFSLMIVLLIKPVTAIGAVLGLGYSVRTALTVGVGLAQVGEFSFILATQAQNYKLIGPEVYNVLVVCALFSISLNPMLFGLLPKVEKALKKREKLWLFLHKKAHSAFVVQAGKICEKDRKIHNRAIVVGYGPTGKDIVKTLQEHGAGSTVIDLNIDTVNELLREGMGAVYGDASQRGILSAAGVEEAKYLMLTIPDTASAAAVAAIAHSMNPKLHIIARARFLHDVELLRHVGADTVVVEEEQIISAMVTSLIHTMEQPEPVESE